MNREAEEVVVVGPLGPCHRGVAPSERPEVVFEPPAVLVEERWREVCLVAQRRTRAGLELVGDYAEQRFAGILRRGRPDFVEGGRHGWTWWCLSWQSRSAAQDEPEAAETEERA